MQPAQSDQGDRHNFGRRVSVGKRRVTKPRTVVWERLLLAKDSPLRRLLADAAERDGMPGAFGFLPELAFFPARSGLGGQVERVVLEPLPRTSSTLRRELSVIVGRSLALFGFLGVADLHWENLVLGVDSRGQVVFAPLDIEMILADLSLPTETKLLPDADPEYAAICRHAAGVRRVLPYLGKPVRCADLVSMAGAYRRMLEFLERHATGIARVLSRLPGLAATPIRVCLRGTGEYVRAASESLVPPLLEAEAVQLERGDIPYFFRLYGKKGIHYYANRALTEYATIAQEGDVPGLDPVLSLARGLRAPSRKRLREQGLFTLLGAFDHPSFSGRHASAELSVTFGARTFGVTLENGEQLQAPRNLSAVVGSVYLPCRCGEVRSVFVPPVTHCSLAL